MELERLLKFSFSRDLMPEIVYAPGGRITKGRIAEAVVRKWMEKQGATPLGRFD